VVDPSGNPVVLDCGLARDLGEEGPSLTMTGEVFGTLAYMSPEQLSGKLVPIDRRTDVYALGVVLYECVTGKRPFEGLTRESQLRAILTRDPPDPRRIEPAVPRDLAAIIACALEKSRDRRYESARDLAEELRRVRMHEPVRARRPGPLLRSWRWAERNPVVATLGALVLTSLVAGLAVSLHYMTEARTSLAEFERLADTRHLDDLVEESRDELWPAVPSEVAAMDAWLRKARDLATRLPGHEAVLAALRGRAEPYSEAQVARDQRMLEPKRARREALLRTRPGQLARMEAQEATGQRMPWLE
jgi:hypothetical protein